MAIKIVPKDELLNYVGHKNDPSDWITVDQDRINVNLPLIDQHDGIARMRRAVLDCMRNGVVIRVGGTADASGIDDGSALSKSSDTR